MECPNKNVFAEFVWAKEEFSRKVSTEEGAKKGKMAHKFIGTTTYTLDLPALTDTTITYLCKDAIRFDVFGEYDDVDEPEGEMASLQMPPELFNLATTHTFSVTSSGKDCNTSGFRTHAATAIRAAAAAVHLVQATRTLRAAPT